MSERQQTAAVELRFEHLAERIVRSRLYFAAFMLASGSYFGWLFGVVLSAVLTSVVVIVGRTPWGRRNARSLSKREQAQVDIAFAVLGAVWIALAVWGSRGTGSAIAAAVLSFGHLAPRELRALDL